MNNARIHWIDSLRGLAIILMIIFHFFFDLSLLEIQKTDFHSPFWLIFGHFIRFTFLILVGFSLYLSYLCIEPLAGFFLQ